MEPHKKRKTHKKPITFLSLGAFGLSRDERRLVLARLSPYERALCWVAHERMPTGKILKALLMGAAIRENVSILDWAEPWISGKELNIGLGKVAIVGAACGHIKVINWVLERVPDLPLSTLGCVAAYCGRLALVALLSRRVPMGQAWFYACAGKHEEIMYYLEQKDEPEIPEMPMREIVRLVGPPHHIKQVQAVIDAILDEIKTFF